MAQGKHPIRRFFLSSTGCARIAASTFLIDFRSEARKGQHSVNPPNLKSREGDRVEKVLFYKA
ncbi:hypothetical protein EVA_02393 [gut metagenome]|uniref:Uncharacterized protein n=1 Tax=gut metagenome TaxID=749906 RepID=J9D9H2_9ZZZZ